MNDNSKVKKIITTDVGGVLYVESIGYTEVVLGAPPSTVNTDSTHEKPSSLRTAHNFSPEVSSKLRLIIKSSSSLDIKTLNKIVNNINGTSVPVSDILAFLQDMGYNSFSGDIRKTQEVQNGYN